MLIIVLALMLAEARLQSRTVEVSSEWLVSIPCFWRLWIHPPIGFGSSVLVDVKQMFDHGGDEESLEHRHDLDENERAAMVQAIQRRIENDSFNNATPLLPPKAIDLSHLLNTVTVRLKFGINDNVAE